MSVLLLISLGTLIIAYVQRRRGRVREPCPWRFHRGTGGAGVGGGGRGWGVKGKVRTRGKMRWIFREEINGSHKWIFWWEERGR